MSSTGKYCFLQMGRSCGSECMAYEAKTNTCKVLNLVERITPAPSRPVAPTAPPKART